MLGRLYKGQTCSAARALELVGERWSLLILRDAMFRNFTRFQQFQKSLGIAPNILTTRLEGFVDAGLMKRRVRKGSSEPPEYLLTRKGKELKPVIIALTQWGDKWVRPGPIEYVDGRDRRPVAVQLRRTADDDPVTVDDVVVRKR
jgi:DNA-binding HxlR family transcriptional regulator